MTLDTPFELRRIAYWSNFILFGMDFIGIRDRCSTLDFSGLSSLLSGLSWVCVAP